MNMMQTQILPLGQDGTIVINYQGLGLSPSPFFYTTVLTPIYPMDTIDIGTIVTPYGPCTLRAIITKYSDNDALAVSLEGTDDGYWSPYATLSVNLPEHAHMLEEDEFFVKLWSENEPLAELAELDIFTDTGKAVPTGFCIAPVWKLNVSTD